MAADRRATRQAPARSGSGAARRELTRKRAYEPRADRICMRCAASLGGLSHSSAAAAAAVAATATAAFATEATALAVVTVPLS